MKSRFNKAWALALGLGIGAAVAFSQPTLAREGGLEDEPGGGTNGSSADNIPVGIFYVGQFFTNQFTHNVGSGTTAPGFATAGKFPNENDWVNANVFLFNPGWTFFGATTQFIFVQPFVQVSTGNNPGNEGSTFGGVNDQLFKADFAWKFGDIHMKIALGAWVPGGTVQGPAGLNNAGLPFFTIQPEFALSWEPSNWLWGANWNFTAYTYWEIDTKNEVSGYQNAPLFHADFTATATWGKWTIGPVADFFTQVGNDTSSPFYAVGGPNAFCAGPVGFECLFPQNLWRWSVGGLIQYNFGPVTIQFWATDIVASHASGGSLNAAGIGQNDIGVNGYTLWMQFSTALWTPPEQQAAPKAPLVYK
jgi:hypothetical protein